MLPICQVDNHQSLGIELTQVLPSALAEMPWFMSVPFLMTFPTFLPFVIFAWFPICIFLALLFGGVEFLLSHL